MVISSARGGTKRGNSSPTRARMMDVLPHWAARREGAKRLDKVRAFSPLLLDQLPPFYPSLSLSSVNATLVNEVCSILRSKAHYSLHITDKSHSFLVPPLKSFSIHTPQPALRYCIISSGQKGPWHLRSPTSRILTILRSWDAIFPSRVYGQWADPGADGCGSYYLITPIRITCNATEISGWECGWRCSLVPRPARNGKVGFRD